MKKIIAILISVTITLVVFSCKKKNDKLTISGNAYNSEILQKISDVKVDLYAKKLSNNTWNGQYSLIETTYTQSDGSFIFEFDNMRVSDFKLAFSKQGYITSEYVINPDLVQKGENYNKTYNVHFESWLKLLIKNFPPTSTNDVLSYRFLKGLDNIQDTLKYFNGSNIDTINVWRIYGSQWAVIEWNVFSNSNHVQHIDSLWVPINDTLVYNLYY